MDSAVFVLFVTLSCLQFATSQFYSYFDDDSPVFFPGPTKAVTYKWGDIFNYQIQETEEVPEECKNQNFCTVKPKNYPQAKFNSYFHGVLTFVPQPSEDLDGNKQGDPSERDDCASSVTFEPLYKVKSRKDEWRTVVQSPNNNFVQRIRLETCKDPEGTCFKVFPSLKNFATACKQTYNIWELMVEGDDGPETIKVDLPVCCSCVYRSLNG